MSQIYAQERTELFQRLKALFEFDAKGVLPCMAPGMAGPMGLPLGHLDLTQVKFNGEPLNAHLTLSWGTDEKAQLLGTGAPSPVTGGVLREATNDELRCSLEHYAKAVEDYRKQVLRDCVPEGQEAPLFLQKRLGLAPYFA